MANILDFTTPTGQTGNILKPMSWVPLILGGVVLLGTFAAAQRIGTTVHNKLPIVDTNPYSPFQARPVATAQSTKMYIG